MFNLNVIQIYEKKLGLVANNMAIQEN